MSVLLEALGRWGATYRTLDVRIVTGATSAGSLPPDSVRRQHILTVVRFCRESVDEVAQRHEHLHAAYGRVQTDNLRLDLHALEFDSSRCFKNAEVTRHLIAGDGEMPELVLRGGSGSPFRASPTSSMANWLADVLGTLR